MKKTDKLAELLITDIQDKIILEPACGAADCSLSASRYAQKVYCIDLDHSRISGKTLCNNVYFQTMDAVRMMFPDKFFDSIIFYNAFAHIEKQWTLIQKECMRVLKPDGVLYIVGTWKLDIHLMQQMFSDKAKQKNDFLIVYLSKAS